MSTEPLTLARLDAIIAKFRAREEMGIGSAEFGEILELARREIVRTRE